MGSILKFRFWTSKIHFGPAPAFCRCYLTGGAVLPAVYIGTFSTRSRKVPFSKIYDCNFYKKRTDLMAFSILKGINFAYRFFSSSGSKKESFQNFILSKSAAASFNRLRDDLARDQGAWTLRLPIKQALDPIVDSHNRWPKRGPT